MAGAAGKEDVLNFRLGQHMGLVGSTGGGKTYWAKHFLLPRFNRVLVVDSEQMEFDDYRLLKIGSESPRVLKASIPRDVKKGFHWRISPPRAAKPQWMEGIAAALLDITDSHMVVYIDEVTDFSDAQWIGDMMKELVRKGRKRHLSVVWASQRAPGVNHWLAENSVWRVLFFTLPFDRVKMDKFWPGMSKVVAGIEYDSHDFIMITPSGAIKIYGAV